MISGKNRTHHQACKLSSFLKYPFRQTCYLPWRVQNSSNTVSRSNGCLIFTDLSPTTRPQSSRWRGVFRICNKREIVKFRQDYSFRLVEHSIRCVFDMISICVRPAHEGKHERRPFSWSAKPNHGGRRISHTFYKGLSNKIFISPAFWLVNPFYVRPVHVSKYQPIIMEYIIPYIHCRAL